MAITNVISFNKPKSIASESYRALRTNLEFSLSSDDSKEVLITSCHVSEGKSSIAANLAAVFAMQGKKTILIDADMRRGVQHKNFGVSNRYGLSNFLANIKNDDEDYIKKTDISNLSIITSGPVPPNPSELLSLPKAKQFFLDLKEYFDIIIIDGAPVLPVTDSVILSPIVDRVVFVVSSRETKKDELKTAKGILDNAGANISGIVLNKYDLRSNGYYNYKKGYYHSYYGEKDKKDSKK